MNEEDLIPVEQVFVTLTHRGYVKRLPLMHTAYSTAVARSGQGAPVRDETTSALHSRHATCCSLPIADVYSDCTRNSDVRRQPHSHH